MIHDLRIRYRALCEARPGLSEVRAVFVTSLHAKGSADFLFFRIRTGFALRGIDVGLWFFGEIVGQAISDKRSE